MHWLYGEMASAMPKPRLSIWRHRDFLLLWSATAVSQLGTQITFLALPFIAVTLLDASPLDTSILAMLGWAPMITLGLVAGAIVDRMRRQPLLIGCDVARALAVAAIPITYLAGWLSLWHLYATVLITGLFSTLFDLAYQARLPTLVARDDLIAANSGLELAQSGTRIIGPGLTGALIAVFTAPVAILFDALSYLASALLLLGIRQPEPPLVAAPRAGSVTHVLRREMREGMVSLWRQPLLRTLLGATLGLSIGWALVEGILMFYIVRTLALPAEAAGAVFSIGNIGLLIAAALASQVTRRWGLGPVIVGAAGLQTLGLTLLALAPLAPLALLTTGYLMRAAGVVLYNLSHLTLRQSITPLHLLGRVSAAVRVLGWASIPVGLVAGGWLATLSGPSVAIWSGAAFSALALVPLALGRIWQVRTAPAPAP
jgi:Na+/melibiose symporter-like transporter